MKKIAIIGAGIFGCVTAIELSKSGFEVVVFERAEEILSGASTINHLRHHYGFHYPRSKETVEEIKKARASFEQEFEGCITEFFDDYYGVSLTGSKTTPEDFIKFCDDMELPYKIEWPEKEEYMDKSKIGVCVKTPERVYDPEILKGMLLNKMRKVPIKLKLFHQVVGGEIDGEIKRLRIKCNEEVYEQEFDYVINATYCNFNNFNKWFGLSRKKLQYELIELLELKVPINKKIGLTIMDGEFSSLLPRGERGTFTLGHVKESILDVAISDDLDPVLMASNNIKSNKEGIMREGIKDYPFLKDAIVLRSMFVTRVVKPDVDDTDERPSEITEYGNGMYSIFGGKVITCVDIAKEIDKKIKQENQIGVEKQIKGILIYPPNQLMDVERARPDGSLGLLYLAAALEEKGIKTDILDASVGTQEQNLEETFYKMVKRENGLIRIGMEFKDIADYVVKKGYDFVGIHSNLTPQTKMAFETAKAIKKANPKIKIYAGGVNARALKNRFLETGDFDGICLTEGELIFPKMILEGIENAPGFAYKDNNGNIKINPVNETCFPKELDDLPMPAWEKLPFDKYDALNSVHGTDVTENINQRYAPIMTSRGCVWQCKFCHISTEKGDIGQLRLHSIKRVIAEIKRLKSLGVKKLFFEDDTLLVKKERVKEIFREIKDEELTILNVNGVNLIDFFDRTKEIEGKWKIDKEYLHILKDAGFNQMVFPVESGCQRILNKYATGKVQLNKMDIPLLMKTMTEMGILAPVNMIIGFPDETEEEIQQSIDLGKKLKQNGAPYISFFLPIPFPGSKLYDLAIECNYLDKNFNPDIMNWKRPMMKNTVINPKRLEEIRDKANEEINDEKFIEGAVRKTIGYRWSNK